MKILFENEEYWICIKPPEAVSEQTPLHDGFADLLAEQNGGYVGVIHRLDRGVGGVMVYAKTKSAAARLSEEVRTRRLKKEYLAFLSHVPEKSEGELSDFLYHDRKKNRVYTVKKERNGVKDAKLFYRVLCEKPLPGGSGTGAYVSVEPLTGRTHQIRVQFASRGFPIVGDRKYGDRTDWKQKNTIGLCCFSVTVDGVKYSLEKPLWED